MFNSSGHLRLVHEPEYIKDVVDRAAACIKKHVPGVQAIAFSGVSGAAIAYPLEYLLGIRIINIRKKDAKTHGCSIEASEMHTVESYIIVDDLIDSGNTMRFIIESIYFAGVPSGACKGIYLYNHHLDGGSFYHSGAGGGKKIPFLHLL